MSDKMITYIYRIDCVTNLHVGSGEANYSVVDNEVERDPVTGLPTIYSSGIKGALREHFENLWQPDDPKVIRIFGSAPNAGANKNDDSESKIIPGSFKFLNALLAARPVRVSIGSQPYVMATSAEQINSVLALAKALGVASVSGVSTESSVVLDIAPDKFYSHSNVRQIEGFPTAKLEGIPADDERLELVGGKLAAFAAAVTVNEIALPVVAHNYLEAGISKNLWYEEFVPYRSVFYTAIMAPADMKKELEGFDEQLCSGCVQLGANASIGYGLCQFTRVGQSN